MSRDLVLNSIAQLRSLNGLDDQDKRILGGARRRRQPRAGRNLGGGLISDPAPFGYGAGYGSGCGVYGGARQKGYYGPDPLEPGLGLMEAGKRLNGLLNYEAAQLGHKGEQRTNWKIKYLQTKFSADSELANYLINKYLNGRNNIRYAIDSLCSGYRDHPYGPKRNDLPPSRAAQRRGVSTTLSNIQRGNFSGSV